MDNGQDVLDVHSSGTNGSDSGASAKPEPVKVRPEDLVPITKLTLEQIAELAERFKETDVPRMSPHDFMMHLSSRPDSWFVKAGEVGVIFLTEIVPHFDANFHAVFWDKRLTADRREAIKTVLGTAFEWFDLRRISAIVPSHHNLLFEVLTKKVGFKHEGRVRQGWSKDSEDDILLLGMLKEEMPWPWLKIKTTSGE